jgi:hypothetical protein
MRDHLIDKDFKDGGVHRLAVQQQGRQHNRCCQHRIRGGRQRHLRRLPLGVGAPLAEPPGAQLPKVDFLAMASAQRSCPEVKEMMNSNTLQITTQAVGDASLLGDVWKGVFRPLVPIEYREAVFQSLHSIHHPGVRSTRRLIAARFCRPQMAKAITLMASAARFTNMSTYNQLRYRFLTAVSPTSTSTYRTAATLPRPHLPVHDNRQDIKVAGGRSPLVHHRRRLHQGPLRRLGIQIWSACHHHFRQRGPVHVRLVGGRAALCSLTCFMILINLYDSKCRNTGIPEKVSPKSEFPPVVNFVSPASVFQHQGQSGTAGHGLVQHCPAMHFGE